jgi:hypothetical protein
MKTMNLSAEKTRKALALSPERQKEFAPVLWPPRKSFFGLFGKERIWYHIK